MIRTRDFLLFLLFVAFLLLGIFVTVIMTWENASVSRYSDSLFNQNTATSGAVVIEQTDDKASRLESLRQKIAAMSSSILAPAIDDTTAATTSEPTTATSTTDTDTNEVSILVQKCSNYRKSYPSVLNGLLTYKLDAGQRMFFDSAVTVDASSSVSVNLEPAFILPMRITTQNLSNCLVSDIVAITPSGLPIRNDDYIKYSAKGESALIGYTLDGYELYGPTKSLETDNCGGVAIEGKYRYYVSVDRKAVLNCFVGVPVAI